MTDIIVYGAGGHAIPVIEAIESTGKYTIVGLIDDGKELGTTYYDYQILGQKPECLEYIEKKIGFFVAIGNTEKRKEICEDLLNNGAVLPAIVSSNVKLPKYYTLGENSIVMGSAHIGGAVDIGDNCIINTGVIIEHGVQIGNNCHLAPGVIVNGGIKICDNVTIASGSVVTKNIEEEGVYLGIPAKILHRE